MHLAFVGVCPLSAELVLAAISLGHRVTWFTSDEDKAAAARVASGRNPRQFNLERHDAWESLLDSPTVDGVILAEVSANEVDLRSDQWRRLAQGGSRILFIHPLVPSLLVYLEVDMLAREHGTILIPYWPDAFSDAAADLERATTGVDNRVGGPPLEQVAFRRLLVDRSPQEVTKWFARDAALLDLVAGPFSEIAAIGPNTSDAAYASLAVHLHGPRGVPVRWEVGRAQAGAEGRMTTSGGGELAVTLSAPEGNEDAAENARAEAVAGIAAIADGDAKSRAPLQDWSRCVRAMELADSIEISLRRGRRIDVYYRPLTEETSYKGMMSAFGCGLLLLAPLVLFIAGIMNAVFGWRLTRFWYLPVLVIFVGFLILQVFARIMASRAAPETADDARQTG